MLGHPEQLLSLTRFSLPTRLLSRAALLGGLALVHRHRRTHHAVVC